MKYLFFLLILVNVVFYLWETGVNQPSAPENPPTAETSIDAERIVLVKELQEPRQPAPDSAPATESPAAKPELEAAPAPNRNAETTIPIKQEEPLPAADKKP